MAIYKLKNDIISIAVDSRGAELKSLKKMDTQQEYMWCGDTEYWGHTSPILFPFVGGLKNNQYRTKGAVYPMTENGFAYDMEFILLSKSADEIWFELYSNAETMEKYPYAFILKSGYRLEENRVIVLWQVENPGTEVLHFSIGGHPAFKCPIESDKKMNECFMTFGYKNEIVFTRTDKNGLAIPFQDIYSFQSGWFPLFERLFDKGTLIIENNQTHDVALWKSNRERYISVTMEAPMLSIWSPPKKHAPFICIEPWYGRCDNRDFCGTLEERKFGNRLNPGKIWKASYSIEV